MSISRKVAVLACAAILVATPASATAQPVQDQQCQNPTWAKLHSQICYRYNGGPFGIGGGGGNDGGILGTIGRVLGGLTGGLL